jgi:hypothetical protein
MVIAERAHRQAARRGGQQSTRDVASLRSGVRSSRTGMALDPALPIDSWKAIGAKLGMHADATCWWLGDWLTFGRSKYGRRYKEGITVTGLKYQTLRNYAVVARSFDVSRRRDDLSFQHHAEVSALSAEAQDRWLDLAAQNGWSKAELRARLRAKAIGQKPDHATGVLHLVFEAEREQTWRQAADRSRRSLNAWAMRVLDQAAASELDALAADDQ